MSDPLRSLEGMNTVQFVHTADWQLGMHRWFLAERQSSFDDARIDALRRMLDQGRERGAQFVVAAGDVFDSNTVPTGYVVRALDVLGEGKLPVYLLPGNHDLLSSGSVFLSRKFRDYCPDNVHVVADSAPIEVAEGVYLAGVPVRSKFGEPVDLDAVVAGFPAQAQRRILVLHGGTDSVYSGNDEDGLGGADYSCADLERITSAGAVDYIALGDRHSTTDLVAGGRAWYSGAPEVTAFDDKEKDSGNALLVQLSDAGCTVEKVRTGAWKFLRRSEHISSAEDVARLKAMLDEIPDKQRTVVKLQLDGAASLEVSEQLSVLLADYKELFANVYQRRSSRVHVRPESLDLEHLFSGYTRSAAAELLEMVEQGGESCRTAEDALGLLYGLSQEGK